MSYMKALVLDQLETPQGDDSAYDEWLMQLAAQAANEQEMTYVDNCSR